MFIYLLKCDNKYKIGISKQPFKRVKQLQTGNSAPIKIVHTYESKLSSKIETTLHNIYQMNRKIGEWFELNRTIEDTFLSECEQVENTLTILNNAGNKFI